jgi:hypothetical protein
MIPRGEKKTNFTGAGGNGVRHQILIPGQHIKQEETVILNAAGNHERLKKPEAQVVRQ